MSAANPGTLRQWAQVRKRRRLRGAGPYAHFLHVPKTGGTALRHALGEITCSAYTVVVHPHRVTLRHLPRGDAFFFAVRDPVDRFVSAYNGRLRMGRPSYDVTWSAAEQELFLRYDSVERFAEALDSSRERPAALGALRAVPFVHHGYWNWFENERTVRRRATRVMWVGRHPSLDADVARLGRLLGAGGKLHLPDDAVAAHRSPRSEQSVLSSDARAVIEELLADDFRFLDVCDELGFFSDRAWVTRP